MAQLSENPRVIDMHTHMFNARYLPLRGIFKSFGTIPDKFIKPLAIISWFLTDYSKFPSIKRVTPSHLNRLDFDDRKLPKLEESQYTASYIESLSLDCQALILESLKGSATSVKMTEAVVLNDDLDALQSASTRQLAITTVKATLEASDFSAAAFGDKDVADNVLSLSWQDFPFADMFRTFFTEVFQPIEHALDYLDFIWNLTQSEQQIYTRIKQFYESLGVDCHLVHHMMDMSHPYQTAYGDKKYGKVKMPYYGAGNQRSQLSQMKKLSEFADGSLTGFSAFDPWRFCHVADIKSSVITALESAQNQFNMMGFKIYPPMGYRPDMNEGHPELQIAVASFLEYCAAHNIPVFAHCTPSGFEIGKNSGLNSDPKYWRNVIEKNSWGRDLRLCLGHAGGGRHPREEGKALISAGWVSSQKEWDMPGNYAAEVVSLCRDFPKVYCELANIDSILDDETHAENLARNLSRELNLARPGSYDFSEKIMYGTDWHMVGMVNDVVKYYLMLSGMFQRPALRDFKSEFFSKNALRFLKSELSY